MILNIAQEEQTSCSSYTAVSKFDFHLTLEGLKFVIMFGQDKPCDTLSFGMQHNMMPSYVRWFEAYEN